ncbi:MAG: Dabb family protein [Candidatus Thiodiazotropha endolucinida]
MIKHIVMWTYRKEDRDETIKTLKSMFDELQGKIDGLLRLEIGINTVPDAAACDMVLYSEFEDWSALEFYQNHPDHQRIKEYTAPRRRSRHQVDYEC